MTVLDYAAIGLVVSFVVACAAGAYLRRLERDDRIAREIDDIRAQRLAELAVMEQALIERVESYFAKDAWRVDMESAGWNEIRAASIKASGKKQGWVRA